MEWAIETSGLTKQFGSTRALAGVDLRIPRGSVYGLLGPNGAGKTTIIRVLATLVKPTAGTALVLGHDVVAESRQVRRAISLTGQFASVDNELTGRENLILIGRLVGLGRRQARARADELLAAFGLAEAGRRLVDTYSGGMKRRLDIAASLVVTPEILFLDEPTTGLDPRSRSQVWDAIRAIAASGTTVLLTTQYLEEADRLADRLAVIDHGRIIAEGTSHDLKATVGSNALHIRLRDPAQRPRAADILRRQLGDGVTEGSEPTVVSGPVNPLKVEAAIKALRKAGVAIAEYSVGAPSLDEVFFALTGAPAEKVPAAAAQAGVPA